MSKIDKTVINYGIALFKIVSMLMVVMLHVLGQGGILDSSQGLNNKFAWWLEIMSIGAVNCFGLITGYLMVYKQFSFVKLVNIWFQVFFYSFGISLLFYILGYGGISLAGLYKFILPVTTGQYWYVTAYFVTFLLMPILNLALNSFDQKTMSKQLFIFFVLFSASSILPKFNGYNLSAGYSWMWLSYLYMLGGYYRKYYRDNVRKFRFPFAVYLLCAGFTFVFKFFISKYIIYVNWLAWFDYIGPTTLIGSIALLSYFDNLNINSKFLQKSVLLLSNLSFGVYLLHVHMLVWNNMVLSRFAHYSSYDLPVFLTSIFSSVLVVYFMGVSVDFIRDKLFKALEIEKLSMQIGNKLDLLCSIIN